MSRPPWSGFVNGMDEERTAIPFIFFVSRCDVTAGAASATAGSDSPSLPAPYIRISRSLLVELLALLR